MNTGRILILALCFFTFSGLIFGAPAQNNSAKKIVKYACEEYGGNLINMGTNGSLLIPWPGSGHLGMSFLDGIFMQNDDTKIAVIMQKKNSETNQTGHTVYFRIFNTIDRTWTELGSEILDDKLSIVPVMAGPVVFSFMKLPEQIQPEVLVEQVTYSLSGGTRTSVFIKDKNVINRLLFYGKYEVSGLSLERKLNDYGEYIKNQRIEKSGKLYDGLVIVKRKEGTKEEVLRFGGNPFYLRHTPNITFDFRDRRNFLFGFYNVDEKKEIYYIDGVNMVFRHRENGVGVKEYLNLSRLRAVNKTMEKMLFMAEDDFGARIVLVPLALKMRHSLK